MNTVLAAPQVSDLPVGLDILCQIAALPTREDRNKLIALMLTLPQVELPLKHHFSPGVYVREIFMPAGSIVIGKLHATEHLNIVSAGLVSVWTEQAGMKLYNGPWTFNSVIGTRKFLYCHTDVTWTTIHVTDETDVEKLEKLLVIDDQFLVGVQ